MGEGDLGTQQTVPKHTCNAARLGSRHHARSRHVDQRLEAHLAAAAAAADTHQWMQLTGQESAGHTHSSSKQGESLSTGFIIVSCMPQRSVHPHRPAACTIKAQVLDGLLANMDIRRVCCRAKRVLKLQILEKNNSHNPRASVHAPKHP
jgi:hypothetical protein